MTVLEKARSTEPRSALRYRPITTGLESPSQTITRARKSRPDVRVTTAPAVPDDLDHERHPVSRHARPVQQTRTNRYMSPWWFIGAGFVVTLRLWVGTTQLLAWGTNQYNAIVYGSQRTFQIDSVVGQGDSPQHPSHFESINLHGVVTILEFPAGDAHHLRVLATYTVPGAHADQVVAILRFLDVNHNGQPDLLTNIGGLEYMLVNDQGTFRAATPAEQQQILDTIQQN